MLRPQLKRFATVITCSRCYAEPTLLWSIGKCRSKSSFAPRLNRFRAKGGRRSNEFDRYTGKPNAPLEDIALELPMETPLPKRRQMGKPIPKHLKLATQLLKNTITGIQHGEDVDIREALGTGNYAMEEMWKERNTYYLLD